MGGRIEALSEPGVGSVFRVFVPLERGAPVRHTFFPHFFPVLV